MDAFRRSFDEDEGVDDDEGDVEQRWDERSTAVVPAVLVGEVMVTSSMTRLDGGSAVMAAAAVVVVVVVEVVLLDDSVNVDVGEMVLAVEVVVVVVVVVVDGD